MACNPNRVNCSPEDIMAAADPNCGKIVNVDNLQAEQLMYDQSYSDLINNYGIEVQYYINPFNLSAADLLYGEEPTKVFQGPLSIQMYIEMDEDAYSLSKYGFDATDELTGYLHITTFATAASAFFDYASVGQVVEPKAGDLTVLGALSCDRPNGRGPRIFEITERRDEDLTSINPMLGHYVWRIRAKRYEHSFEPGAPRELVNDQIFENSFTGTLSTNISGDSVSDGKSYTWDIDDASRDDTYDMDNNDNSIYGDYY